MHRRNPIYERWRWQIFAITWLAYAGLYLTRKSFSVAKIGIGRSPAAGGLGMSDVEMGWVDLVNLAAYAVGQILFGMAGDKVGPRRIVLGGMIVSVATALAMGASSAVVVMGVLLCVQGLCQATGWG